MAISDTQIQEEMLAAITAKALPVVAAACTEVCSRHLAALHQQLQQLRFLQQQMQQLQAQANFQAQDQRQSWPASRTTLNAGLMDGCMHYAVVVAVAGVAADDAAAGVVFGCCCCRWW
ncbi:hypothetical protein AK812_SmicGene26079 [Symbiodinium microadriaticum]|uniref:Uncharacterized protein n=1 Tax=Symbiodinium microadriaticum TaxID=2951 RepID=A0A1Q9DAD0_SYMMI|nr:hypothetical protein AK812_SmicGene26079 [Symbiodinium microadriaticum]